MKLSSAVEKDKLENWACENLMRFNKSQCSPRCFSFLSVNYSEWSRYPCCSTWRTLSGPGRHALKEAAA